MKVYLSQKELELIKLGLSEVLLNGKRLGEVDLVKNINELINKLRNGEKNEKKLK